MSVRVYSDIDIIDSPRYAMCHRSLLRTQYKLTVHSFKEEGVRVKVAQLIT